MASKKSKLNARNEYKRQLEEKSRIQTFDTDKHTDVFSTEDEDEYYGPDTSGQAYMWLLFFSSLMFTFPFLTFYAVKHWIENSFGIVGFENNCISVLSAVIVVNFIICMYVFKAFREDTQPLAVQKKNK